jgi:hypothetical protein
MNSTLVANQIIFSTLDSLRVSTEIDQYFHITQQVHMLANGLWVERKGG